MTTPTPEERVAAIETRLTAANVANRPTWDLDSHSHIEAGCRCMSCWETTVWQTTNMRYCDEQPQTLTDRGEDTDRCESSGYSYADADLIAHAPDDLRALLALVASLRAEVAALHTDWAPELENDGTHEWTAAYECSGEFICAWKRRPAMSRDASSWEREETYPTGLSYPAQPLCAPYCTQPCSAKCEGAQPA